MRVVVDDMFAGERATAGLKWSGVELFICIGNGADTELGLPPLAGGDFHGFSILQNKKRGEIIHTEHDQYAVLVDDVITLQPTILM